MRKTKLSEPVHVLVLGGYGAAGSLVARLLAPWIQGRITIAGRSLAAAQRYCAELDDTASGVAFVPCTVDVTETVSLTAAVEGHDLVIVCTPMSALAVENLVKAALAARTDCVEMAPGREKFEVLERYRREIESRSLRIIVDAGADPGLPGWLARYAANLVQGGAELELYAKYRDRSIGTAGVADMLEFMSGPRRVFVDGWRTAPWWSIRRPAYPGGLGRSLSVPVFLPELASVPAQTGLQRMALYHAGVNPVTDWLTAAWVLGLKHLLPVAHFVRGFRAAIEKFTPKPMGLAMIAQVKGDGGSARVELSHSDLYRATAQAAVLAVLALRSQHSCWSGCRFLGECVDAQRMKRDLDAAGFRITIDRAPG